MTKITGVAENQYFTSALYPTLIDSDVLSADMTPITTPTVYSIPTETVSLDGLSATEGVLRDIVVTYDNTNPAAIDLLGANNISITSANLEVVTVIVTYNEGLIEQLSANNISIVSANLEVVLNPVIYNNGTIEQLSANNIQIISGTLT